MDGVELAHIARKYNPDLDVIVTSGKPLPQQLPDGAKFWSKPWTPLDVIREAERDAVRPRFCALGRGQTPGGPSGATIRKSKGGPGPAVF